MPHGVLGFPLFKRLLYRVNEVILRMLPGLPRMISFKRSRFLEVLRKALIDLDRCSCYAFEEPKSVLSPLDFICWDASAIERPRKLAFG